MMSVFFFPATGQRGKGERGANLLRISVLTAEIKLINLALIVTLSELEA